MEENNLNDTNARIAEIERLIQDFKEKFKAGTTDADSFITITEIELLWGELQNKTNNIYSDMIRKLMSEVDERDLIRKKKETTKLKE
jgi:SUMO ligase MMS21 Smc5/6 complex component